MPKGKNIRVALKKIVDAQKIMKGFRLHFHVSRIRVRIIIKKFRVLCTLQNKTDGDRKRKIT